MFCTVKASFISSLLLVVLVCSCTTAKYQSLVYTGDPYNDALENLKRAPQKDKVLWEYKLSVIALRKGLIEESKQHLDNALSLAGSIITNDKNARKARSLFSGESAKTFIGEPYERVMAHYYRGIIYWMQGELDNARACFRNAQIQDADAENKSYASDYVLLDYLDGFITTKLNGDGSMYYKRALESARLTKPPPYLTNANVMFFVEMGEGPKKFATGEYGQELRFSPGKSSAKKVLIKIGDKTIIAPAYDDLTYQATTRGGRVMDHIIGNKVVFKESTDTLGNAAVIGGAAVALTSKNNDVALGLIAAGLASKIIASATNPSADIRCWDNLPQYIGFGAAYLPPGQYSASVEFQNDSGETVKKLSQPIQILVPADGKDVVVFVSDSKN